MEKNYPLRTLSTWRIGGPAEYVYWPESWEEVAKAWHAAKECGVPIRIIGRGSNLLFPDQGLPGITVVSTALKNIVWGNYSVRVGAGFSLALLAQEVGERGWSGLEFARGIPGTVGGAIIMNAGAHGGEISDRLEKVKVLTEEGSIQELYKSELQFGYRESSLREKAWILEAELSFLAGEREKIIEKMREYLTKRSSSQPLDLPNAGSVFRNPPGNSAGRLIESAGWKGKSIGGAQVSPKHANFIVNAGGAKASDILQLISLIQTDIKEKFGVELKPEVQYLSA